MERNEQVAYSNKMKSLIKKEVTVSFMMEHQAPKGGKIDIAVFKTGDVSLTSKIKAYLWKHFSISVAKINGHGNAETTLVVNMSELSPESFEKIDSEYSRVFPEGNKKKKKEIISAPKDDGKDDGQEEKVIDNIAKCRLMTISFLNSILSFNEEFLKPEGEKRTDFLTFVDDDGDKTNQIIACIDELVACDVELALVWLIGDATLVVRTGSELLVNFTKMLDGGKKLSKIGFCLPPTSSATTEEIFLRLSNVLGTSKPQVTDLGRGIFDAKYMRISTVEKLYSLLPQMGWFVRTEGNILHIFTGTGENKPRIEVKKETSKKEEEVKTLPEQISPNKHFISPRELSASDGGNVSTASNEKPSVFKVLYQTQREAIEKFQEVYKNRELWEKVSEDKRNKIIELLRADMRKRLLDDFIFYLLSTENKIPDLLWNEEEAINELSVIVCTSEFKNCKPETRKQTFDFLKKKLTGIDPDTMVGDLLDLF